MPRAMMAAHPTGGRTDVVRATRASGERAGGRVTGVFQRIDHGTRMVDNRRAEVAHITDAQATLVREIARTGRMVDRGRVVEVDPRVLELIAPKRRRG